MSTVTFQNRKPTRAFSHTGLAFLWGAVATLLILGFGYGIVAVFSGSTFALKQLHVYWYYNVPLAIGFGFQVGAYVYMRQTMKMASASSLAVSGTTSGVAMAACCAHHVTDVLPLLGVAGVISGLGQYQRQFFWIALGFNLIGVAYAMSRLMTVKRLAPALP